MEKNQKVATKNAMENFNVVYSLETVYERGFFWKLAKAGKGTLNEAVKEWSKPVRDELYNNNEVLEIINELTVAFFETALKSKNGATAVVPIGSGDFVFGYDLDKNKSVFLFNIYEKK